MRKNYIKTLPFTEGWNIEKLTYFNTELGQFSVMPGEVVFDIGDATEVLFMVKAGELQIEAEVEIEEQNQFPVSQDRWEINITKR